MARAIADFPSGFEDFLQCPYFSSGRFGVSAKLSTLLASDLLDSTAETVDMEGTGYTICDAGLACAKSLVFCEIDSYLCSSG